MVNKYIKKKKKKKGRYPDPVHPSPFRVKYVNLYKLNLKQRTAAMMNPVFTLNT